VRYYAKPKASRNISRNNIMVKTNCSLKTLSREAENLICKQLIKRGNYGKLVDFPPEINKNISKDTMISIRQSFLRFNAMINLNKLKNIDPTAKVLYSEYTKGANIKSLAYKYNIPPLLLFRRILKFRKLSDNQIKDVLRGDHKVLDQRDKVELKWSLANDQISNPDQSDAIRRAVAFEDHTEDWLKKLGVQYKTQNELATEQVKQLGQATITPDFKIESEFYINGKRIHWVECKSFYLPSRIKQMTKSIEAQVNKYYETYGSGAILFKHGCTNDFKLAKYAIICSLH